MAIKRKSIFAFFFFSTKVIKENFYTGPALHVGVFPGKAGAFLFSAIYKLQ